MQRTWEHDPRTHIIAFVARKGGVTKTTLTAHVGQQLAAAGARVVLVEADGQGSLSKLMGRQPADGFYRLIAQDAEWNDVLVAPGEGWATEQGELWLLPSADGNLLMAGDSRTGALIDERFAELRGFADYILIDTSPAIDEINNAWFYVADWLLLPTLCERPSVDQLRENTFAYIELAQAAAAAAGRPSARVRGIIPNRYETNTHVHSANVARLQRLYGEQHRIFPVLRNKPIWNTAADLRQSIGHLSTHDNIGIRRQAMMACEELRPVVDSLLALEPAGVTS